MIWFCSKIDKFSSRAAIIFWKCYLQQSYKTMARYYALDSLFDKYTSISETYYEHSLCKLRPWLCHSDPPTDRSQLCKDTTSSKQNLERQHLKAVCFVMWQERLPNCEISKLILNHTSCDLFFTKFKIPTVEWRQLTFLPGPYGIHLNKFLLRLIDSSSSTCILGTSSLLRL